MQAVEVPAPSICGEHAIDVFVERCVTVHVNDVLAEALMVSVAVTVTGYVPAVVGMPVITPLEGSIERPSGSPVAE